METGQMIAVTPQMPVAMSPPQAGEAVVLTDQAGGAFEGLLQGMSMQKIKAAAVGNVVPLRAFEQIAVPELRSDAMTALLTTSDSNEQQVTPVQADTAEEAPGTPCLQESTGTESQNVMPDVNGTQLVLLLAQLNGRMPETVATTGSRIECPQEIPHTDSSNMTPLDSTIPVQIRRDAPVLQAAATAPPQVPDITKIAAEKASMFNPPAGNKGAVSTAQIGTAVTEGDKHTVGVAVQVRNSVRLAPELQRQQETLILHIPEAVAESDAVATPDIQHAKAVTGESNGAENRVFQSVRPEIQGRLGTLPPTPTVARPLQNPAQAKNFAAPTELPDTSALPEQPTKVRSGTPLASLLAPAAAVVADAKTESALSSDVRETVTTSQDEQVAAAKISTAETSGEQLFSSEENATPDRGMNGSFPSHALHQQVKTENSPAMNTVSGATPHDAAREALPSEPVVQQVKERLVNHDTKPGSEQIVLRLSPEHLGELKVNLNLDGQRLKVEIVAENRMVRDSLMQHTDALKESLSRQNIKMESFEVTTGGNGSTDNGRGQGDWRELAQQRQNNAWMPDGGYRVAKQVEPALAAYQLKSEHTMVDLHF